MYGFGMRIGWNCRPLLVIEIGGLLWSKTHVLMPLEFSKSFGEAASMPCFVVKRGSLGNHANIDSSAEFFKISSWSLMNAFRPSPYNKGMCTPNMPIRQYAVSSSRVHTLLEAQFILVATLTWEILISGTFLMPVAKKITWLSELFVPRSSFHSCQ